MLEHLLVARRDTWERGHALAAAAQSSPDYEPRAPLIDR